MSYYNLVTGNLSSSKIAKSEDIVNIQSNIQGAFAESITDMFGDACILDGDEEALKITPTPDHIDQENKNFDDADPYISFYDRYFRQKITTEKSEIQSIRVQMQNDSRVEPTIFAEIRDLDMNLKQEANVKLTSTIEQEDPIDVEFIFNLEHLPVGDYYFVLRPVDISSTDLIENGDESIYDVITEDMFKIKIDKGGNYNEGLEASYNGTDYLNSNLLDGEVQFDGDIAVTSENNYDLFFEQVYSSGNTYLITPGYCMIGGQKVHPVDTHITIDGPAKGKNRIDLVTLTEDGYLEVTQGIPYVGKAEEDNYPTNAIGLKIAYITTYANSADSWTCPNCGTVNDGNAQSCSECDTTTNNKIPLIEQDDDNGITRQRDVLERLRRLEKKMNYQVQNNIPSRVKYTCTVDPTLVTEGQMVKVDGQQIFVAAEDSYKFNITTNENGELIGTFKEGLTETFSWSIVKQITTTKSTKKTTTGKMETKDVSIPKDKPKKPTSKQYYNLHITRKVTTTNYVKEKSNTGTEKDHTTSYYTFAKNLPVTIKINTEKGKNKKKISKKTNSSGKIELDLWSYKLGKGTYNIVAEYSGVKVSSKLYIGQSGSINLKEHSAKIKIVDETDPTSSTNVKAGVITGNDSFYTNNMTVDTDNGEVYISSLNASSVKKETWETINKTVRDQANSSKASYVIEPSKQSEYGMISFELQNDCTVYSITPYISSFTNIKEFKIVLFENPKVFNINNSRTSYIKYIATDKAKNTIFENKYASGWIKPKGTSKDGKISVANKDQHKFSLGDNGKFLKAGTYSIVVLGRLKNKKKNGKITFKQYRISNVTKYGGISKVKGTYNPSKIFIEKKSLQSRTWLVKMERSLTNHNTTGTLVSKTIETNNSIRSCKVTPNFEIPAGCDVFTYVSNNGGKTYIEMKNNTNQVTFTGLGHEFRWRLVFNGTSLVTPKLKFNKSKGFAIKFELFEEENYITYEDYGRCFATPIMNANTITRTLVANEHVTNKFEEWEFCRLWMEDEDLAATMDICFAYDNNNYTTTVEHKQSQWPSTIFFSQVLGNLTVDDFSQESIDYSNYNADVEYDENNFRFKFDSNLYNSGETIITTPLAMVNPSRYDYSYGDITNDDIDMSNFDYGLMQTDIVYKDNTDSESTRYSGAHMVAGPYYQAMYKGYSGDTITTTTEDGTTTTNTLTDKVWASDGGDSTYNADACIIGVNFVNGLKIKDEYTSLTFDIFPNLRDCVEKTEESTTETDNTNYDVQIAYTGENTGTITITAPSDYDGTVNVYVNSVINYTVPMNYGTGNANISVKAGDNVSVVFAGSETYKDATKIISVGQYSNDGAMLYETNNIETNNNLSTTGILVLDDNGNAQLDASKKGQNASKYVDDNGYYYIPANTLELVVSLNPYGLIEDDNATYGKAYPITVPLRSCKHTPFTINLSELYGSTIYSFGIRVSKNALKTDITDPSDNTKTISKHPSLHVNDIIGLGNIAFGGYNIRPYLPYVYTGDTRRWNWTAIRSNQLSTAYVLYESKDNAGANARKCYLPIIKSSDPSQSYYFAHACTNLENSNDVRNNNSPLRFYTSDGTALVEKSNEMANNVSQCRKKDSNRITIVNGCDGIGAVQRTSTDNANAIMFSINNNEFGYELFKINMDLDITPYDWVEVEYYVENLKTTATDTNQESKYNIMKGEVVLDLYDTTDYLNSDPIESLPLPAWGKTQNNYDDANKTVHAWFKLHTEASSVKCMVLRTDNPTNRPIHSLNLIISNILFLNTDSVPALGPQMQVRIYPKDATALTNTKIRKFGCVYRLG